MLHYRLLKFTPIVILCVFSCCWLCLLVGCQSEKTKPNSSSSTTKPSATKDAKQSSTEDAEQTLATRSRESLNLTTTLSDAVEVEAGKLEIASPVNWGWAPRNSQYVARFYRDKTRRTRFPRIWVTVKTLSQPTIETVTRDNVMEYAKSIAKQLKEESTAPLLESVKPMVIGDRPCARYVRKTRFKLKDGNNERSIVTERQVLQTIVSGRQFTVELHVLPGEITKFRDLAYAVLAGMNFLDTAEPGQTEEPAASETGEDAPPPADTDSP